MLFCLIYASCAQAFAATDLQEILDWSRAHNPGLGIASTLCPLDGTYIEYLGSEELVVKALFENIRHDSRHCRVTILDQRFILPRAYPDWSLALEVWDDRTKANFRSFSPVQNLEFMPTTPALLAPLIRTLTRSENWNSYA